MAQTQTLPARRSFAPPAMRTTAPVVIRRSGPSPKLLALKAALSKAKSKARDNSTGKGMTLIDVAAVGIGGGVLAALLRKVFGDELAGMDIRLVGGVVVVSAAVFGLKKGKLAQALAMAGAGSIACAIQDIAETYLPDFGTSEE